MPTTQQDDQKQAFEHERLAGWTICASQGKNSTYGSRYNKKESKAVVSAVERDGRVKTRQDKKRKKKR